MKDIIYAERHHFTWERLIVTSLSFGMLYGAQQAEKFLGGREDYPWYSSYLVYLLFFAGNLLLLIRAEYKVSCAHSIKLAEGYKFDDSDIVFNRSRDVIKLASFCCVASIICVCAGISGGTVYSPLFLSYNMIPQVASASQGVLVMVGVCSAFLQFYQLGKIHGHLALLFMFMTFVSALIGILGVN